jgi:hypothetical protein
MAGKKEAIASDLAACKAAFDQVKIPWVIMGGIVLGYARYNDIMAWDTDVDAGVFIEITEAQRQQLLKALREKGFRLHGNKKDFIYGTRKTSFNLWFFHKNGNYYEAFPKSTPGIKFLEKAVWYDEPQIVDFLGDKYPMPNNMDDYLVCQYGKDWETNIIKNHEQYYLEKRGTRKVSQWPAGRGTKEGDMWPKTLRINDSLED